MGGLICNHQLCHHYRPYCIARRSVLFDIPVVVCWLISDMGHSQLSEKKGPRSKRAIAGPFLDMTWVGRREKVVEGHMRKRTCFSSLNGEMMVCGGVLGR